MAVSTPAVARLIDSRETDQSVRYSTMMADTAIPIITAMAKAYTRGVGFEDWNEPNDEIAAVIATASARLASNSGQALYRSKVGDVEREYRSAFTGWTLAELAVLNRYRKRAM